MMPQKFEKLYADVQIIAFDHSIPVQDVSTAFQVIYGKLKPGSRELHPQLRLKEMSFCLDFIRQLCQLSESTGVGLLNLVDQAADLMDSDRWSWNESEATG